MKSVKRSRHRWAPLALVLLFCAVQAEAAWQVTEFRVVEAEPLSLAHDYVPRGLVGEGLRAIERAIWSYDAEMLSDKRLADAAWRRLIEGYLGEIAQHYSAVGLREPVELERDEDGKRYLVRLYDFGHSLNHKEGYAGIAHQPNCGRKLSWIAINRASFETTLAQLNGDTSAAQTQRKHETEALYATLAHELFHAVQYAYDAAYRSFDFCQSRFSGYNRAQVEGSAEAAGNFMAEKRFPEWIRDSSSDSVTGAWNYSRPFVEADDDETSEHYHTSSFWRFLMERYGGLRVMDHLMRVSLPGGRPRSADDVLTWLDRGLQRSSHVDLPLYLVFPEFAADLTQWGDERYWKVDADEWRKKAFGVCLKIELSPQAAAKTLPLALEPLSAKCVQVIVTGLQSGQRVAVKMMAYADDRDSLDALHLGAGALNHVIARDANFNCFIDSRKSGVGRLPVCLEKPFLGKRLSGNASRSDKQTFIEQRVRDKHPVKVSAGGYVKTWLADDQLFTYRLNNIYAVSYIAPKPTAEGKPAGISLDIAIDYGELESSEDGKSLSPDVNINTINPEPAQIEESHSSLNAPLNPETASEMAFLQRGMSSAATQILREEYGQGVAIVYLFDRDANNLSDAELAGANQFTVAVENPIRFGQTGKFTAGLVPGVTLGAVTAGSMILPDNLKRPTARITVSRFDDALLQMNIEAAYCRQANMNFKTGRCRQREKLSASFSKPFGWTYDLDQQFVSIDSPGMKYYRELLSETVFGQDRSHELPVNHDPRVPRPAESGTAQSAQNAGTAAGSDGNPCTCDCAEQRALRTRTEELDRRTDAASGGIPSLSGINMQRLMRCMMQCAAAYAQCEE